MKNWIHFVTLLLVFLIDDSAQAQVQAQVPQLINYQGRVVVGTTNFNGPGQFAFALVNTNVATGTTTTYWSNDGTSTSGSQPTAAVTLPVSQGLYSVLLGDSTLPHMTAIPNFVFANSDVRLRVWFNDGTHGFQLLTPDQRIAAVGYAMMASTVPAGSITAAQIASGAVGTTQLAANAVQSGNIAAGAVGSTQLASGAVGTAQLVPGAVGANQIAAGAITSTQLASGAVGTAQLAPGAVGSTQLASNIALANLALYGNLALPATSSDGTAGVLTLGGLAYLQAPGGFSNNLFVGENAGNLTLSGGEDVALGTTALTHVTSGVSNTALGGEALENNTTGSYDTAVGNRAIFSAKTPSDNTAVGYNTLGGNAGSLNATTGADNTAVGYQALNVLSSGGHNTALGSEALQANTSAADNTAAGYQALLTNTTGAGNSAVGSGALQSNDVGSRNTATGYQALQLNAGATSDNTAVGYQALAVNTSGTQNVAIGSGALSKITSGSNNIAIGFNSGNAVTTGSNNILIGSNAGAAGGSNGIIIGSFGSSIQLPGLYSSTITSGAAVISDVFGTLGVYTSSRRFKTDIHDMGKTSDEILALRPVTFHYKREIDPKATPEFGLVAEEVAKVDPNLVVLDPKNQPYTVRYEAVNAMLLNEFLKQHAALQEQQKEIEALKTQLDELKPRPAAPLDTD